MKYLRNAWYVAAMHDELQPGKLLARTYLDEPVVLFRDAQGGPQALADRCPHRFAPLSSGKLCNGGNTIQCGYHGLQFNGAGACTHNPQGDGVIPKAAIVKAYAVRERHGLIWLWVGEAKEANEALIPDYSAAASAHVDGTIRGYMPTACSTDLFVDNILDLTHVDFLHPTTLGSGALSRARPEVTESGDRSVKITWTSSGDVAPYAFDVNLRKQGQPTDQWTEVTWTAPSTMMIRVGATLQGEPREAGVDTLNLHLATPETAGRTHYWYWSTRNFGLTPEANAHATPMIVNVFKLEDKPMLEAQQQRIGTADFWSLKPVLLPGDAGAVRVRRQLKALIEAQASAAMPV
ncbi:MAG: aromatic ring-hydroxylating dioxygenase subunit alpha [Pseudomonadota bacterium]